MAIAAALGALLVAHRATRAEGPLPFDPNEVPHSVMVDVPVDPGEPSSYDARGPNGQVILFLNHGGGIYTPAKANDSRHNLSSVPPGTVQIPAWDVPADQWGSVMSCMREVLAPFNIAVTDQDPGDAPHLESVIGGQPGLLNLPPSVAGVSPFKTDCSVINNSIVFIFPSVLGDDPRRVCETAAQEMAHSFGLDHEYLCQDPMTYLTGCGAKTFHFEDSVCGEFMPRKCKCDNETQNSAKLLLERAGRGQAPVLWLGQPVDGDRVGAGFSVSAAVNLPPVTVELYLDGRLADAVTPDPSSSAPFQSFEFKTSDTMRSGTHQVKLVARYAGGEQTATVLVDVEGADNFGVLGGCDASGGGGGGTGGAVVVLLAIGAVGLGRRRALWLALLLGGGCMDALVGDVPNSQGSGTCHLPNGPHPLGVGVTWSPSGQDGISCTATLIGHRTALTAAHCTLGDPVSAVFNDRNYTATQIIRHPGFKPGSSADDVALLIFSEPVQDVTPLSLAATAAPVFGDTVRIFGFDKFPADQIRAVVQSATGSVGPINDATKSFGLVLDLPGDCQLGGRVGGPIVLENSEMPLVGIQQQDADPLMFEPYACWAACGAQQDIPLENQPPGCNCSSIASMPCGDCGLEYMDSVSGQWSTCQPAPDQQPCGDGYSCDATATCVAATCSVSCPDAFSNNICAGDTGYRVCPNNPDGYQECTCSTAGTWGSCTPGCIL